MKFALATKQEMTQKFTPDGAVVPVTKLVVEPCIVTQIKRPNTDGYFAIQVATGTTRKLAKPLKGHFKDLGSFRHAKEFRLKTDADQKLVDSVKVGDKITVSTFQSGDQVAVTGISKGRGFQGVVKRHHFHGSPASHGHKDQLRMPGSIGAGGVQNVFKGLRMGGHMGSDQVTVKNLTVVDVDSQDNALYVKGAVPGARGGLIVVSGGGELTVVEMPATAAPAASADAEPTPSQPIVSAPEPAVVEESTQPAPETPAAEEANK